MNNLKIFDKSILRPYVIGAKKAPTIAIVGNSGVFKEDQDRIRNADCVIRFNNYATRENIKPTNDRFKCDILFSTLDLHSNQSKPRDVVIGIPYPFKAAEIPKKLNDWYYSSRHWTVNPYLNMKMCEELKIDSLGHAHPIPSIGFTALWHMEDWHLDIFVAGFSWYFNEEKKTFQGWDLKNKNYPTNWNHNYPKEVEWIIKNLRQKNNIIFSNSCNRILDIASNSL